MAEKFERTIWGILAGETKLKMPAFIDAYLYQTIFRMPDLRSFTNTNKTGKKQI